MFSRFVKGSPIPFRPMPLPRPIAALAIGAAERGVLPERLVRAGIRRIVAARADSLARRTPREQAAVVASLGTGPLTEAPRMANEQHYEVPAAFFTHMLGPRLKYSAGLWEGDHVDLAAAELAMLELTGSRAGLGGQQRVLELGCGWGSLTLWMAERHPDLRITAVTNSTGQAAYVAGEAQARGLTGIDVIVADIASFDTTQRFDRIVTVEMLEHVRNYRRMFGNIATWLAPGGTAFVHVFSHRTEPYVYEDRGPGDWMSRHFFTGGAMPSHGLFGTYLENLDIVSSWRIDGTHYRRTLEAWLGRLDGNRAPATAVLAAAGEARPRLAVQRWRIFLMACSELFGYDAGRAWGISHHVLRHR